MGSSPTTRASPRPAAANPTITYIDGEEGILLHRGYPIEELAEHSDFMEVCYLLLEGELPTAEQKKKFVHDITYHTMLHEQLLNVYRGFRRDAHPMAVMIGVVGALSAFYHDSTDIDDPHQRMIASHRLIAKMPTDRGHGLQVFGRPALHLSAQRAQLRREFPAHDVRGAGRGLRDRSRWSPRRWTASSSCMPTTSRTPRPRRCASPARRGANPFACIAAGIASLWGPAHGGANEAVLNMLREIGSKDKIPEFMKRAKNTTSSA